jgi:hypothetical protein
MNCELESLTTATSKIQAEQAITGHDINRVLYHDRLVLGNFFDRYGPAGRAMVDAP